MPASIKALSTWRTVSNGVLCIMWNRGRGQVPGRLPQCLLSKMDKTSSGKTMKNALARKKAEGV
jgi:hypothetical protein